MISLIPNAGAIAVRSLAVIGGLVAQAIPFALQAAAAHIDSAPNIDNGTRSLMQMGLTVLLVPLGRVIQQNLSKLSEGA